MIYLLFVLLKYAGLVLKCLLDSAASRHLRFVLRKGAVYIYTPYLDTCASSYAREQYTYTRRISTFPPRPTHGSSIHIHAVSRHLRFVLRTGAVYIYTPYLDTCASSYAREQYTYKLRISILALSTQVCSRCRY